MSVPLGIGLCWVFPFWNLRCGCVEMMRGIGGEGFFFSILGYRRGIARVSPEIRELSCLVLSCRCCCYCCWFCWSCCCCCCCLPSHYRAACATRGARSSRHWPGDRGDNSPTCLRPTANARLVEHCLDCIRPCACIFWLVAIVVVKLASHYVFNKIIQNNLKQRLLRCSVHNMIPNFRAIKNTEN